MRMRRLFIRVKIKNKRRWQTLGREIINNFLSLQVKLACRVSFDRQRAVQQSSLIGIDLNQIVCITSRNNHEISHYFSSNRVQSNEISYNQLLLILN